MHLVNGPGDIRGANHRPIEAEHTFFSPPDVPFRMTHVLRIPLTSFQRNCIDEISKGDPERWAYKELHSRFRNWRDLVITLETDTVRQSLPKGPPPPAPEGVDFFEWQEERAKDPPVFIYHKQSDLVLDGINGDATLPEEGVWFEVRIPDAIWGFLPRGLAFQNLWNSTLNEHAKPGQEPQPTYATIGEWAEEILAKRLVQERIAADRSFKTQEEEDLYPGIGEELAPKPPPRPERTKSVIDPGRTGIDMRDPHRRRAWDR